MLTIGQLAQYVGVTVRAVRHYHQCGLLPEPRRDASGYRRYDAQAVLDLIRIRTLVDAGVPLARIDELLSAEPARFAAGVAEIDAALAERIRELKQARRKIAALAAGERLFLPDVIVDFLDRLRALGVSERTVRVERDGWIMLAARHPEAAAQQVEHKEAFLDDPRFQEIYLDYDRVHDWDPDDPRLEELADKMVALAAEVYEGLEEEDMREVTENQSLEAAVVAYLTDESPAWTRLNDLAVKKAQDARQVAMFPETRLGR
ncbi:MAG: MerR family transcriptional regulator [Actinocrinis sp.]